MTTTFNNEDLKMVPTGTRCIKCYNKIGWGILKDGFNPGTTFYCKECYLEELSRKEKLGIKE